MRTWKLPTPTKVVDNLKSTLLGEMASAEWELLEENEWDNKAPEPSQPSQQSHVTATHNNERGLGSEKDGSDSATLVRASLSDKGTEPDSTNGQPNSDRLKGTSGWTKLRNR